MHYWLFTTATQVLDDNTIIMDELAIEQKKLDNLAAQYQLTLDANDYNDKMLKQF